MKRLSILAIVLCVAMTGFSRTTPIKALIHKKLHQSAEQYELMYENMLKYPNMLPRTINQKGELQIAKSSWWTSGFFPGTLWYLHDYLRTEKSKKQAEIMSERVRKEQYTTDNHDVGFMINCSYGNANRLYPSDEHKTIIINAAKSLATRYRPATGLIRSWNWGKWQYPVIIDNMMNLELLFNATRISGDSTYYKIAVAHANNTMKHHFRPDASSYHVVSYDSITGLPQFKGTHQGFSDTSSWSRGQAWALYGYVATYRDTHNNAYLDHALRIASFILNHPHLPADKIPYWDFDAPDIPNAKRDASAGAVICSALIELSGYVNKLQAKTFLKVAETQIRTLSSDEYFAKKGDNGYFILKHSVGSLPHKGEVDVPLTYADYYYVEAMLRYLALSK